MKKINLLLLFTFVSMSSIAQGRIDALDQGIYLDSFEPTLGIGLVIGWGTPYGWGLEMPYQKNENLDFNLGAGIGLSGLKYGLGARYVFASQRRFSPYIALNISSNSGLNNFEVSNYYESGYFRIRPDITGYARAGMRLRLFDIDWFWTIGYAESLLHNRAEHISGDNSYDLQFIADVFLPRGIEVSFGARFSVFKTSQLFSSF